MQTEGRAVFERLNDELERARRSLAEGKADATRVDDRARELISRRGDVLLQLARHYLPEITPSTIEQTFEGIRAELLAILARRQARQGELRRQQQEIESTRGRLDAELDGVTGRLNELVARREQLEARLAERLKGHDDFQRRSRLALQAEERLHRNERRTEEIRAEAAEKLPHYEGSRLFRYLHDRGFGTSDYRGGGLVARLDRWVADLIGYADARRGYEFLRRTPELVAAEVERRRAEFAQLMQQVEAVEHEEAEEIGLAAVLRDGQRLGSERDRQVQELDALQGRARQVREALDQFDQEKDEFYHEALQRLRDFLGSTRTAVLEQRARHTPEPQDDALVAQVAQLGDAVAELQRQHAELTRVVRDEERIRDGLEQVAQRCRRSNYDSQRSYFDGLDLASWLDRFRHGEVDATGLWDAIRRAQRFRPHWVETTARGGADLATSPAGRVLMEAIFDVADAALRQAGRRSMQRRSGSSFPSMPFPNFPGPGSGPGPWSGPSPSPSRSPGPAPAPPRSDGGFTSGAGF